MDVEPESVVAKLLPCLIAQPLVSINQLPGLMLSAQDTQLNETQPLLTGSSRLGLILSKQSW